MNNSQTIQEQHSLSIMIREKPSQFSIREQERELVSNSQFISSEKLQLSHTHTLQPYQSSTYLVVLLKHTCHQARQILDPAVTVHTGCAGCSGRSAGREGSGEGACGCVVLGAETGDGAQQGVFLKLEHVDLT